MSLARLLQRAGAHVDIERACPDLLRLAEGSGSGRSQRHAGQVREAIMDIVVTFPGSLRQHRVDVTIHSPFAESCARADRVAGAAASAAESAKQSRYGPSVLPVAFETCGRLGYKSIVSLQFLQQVASLLGP